MTKKKIIELGLMLGLSFNELTNFRDTLDKDRIVFDGINGQRFVIEGCWPDTKIYSELGKALVLKGKAMKANEIKNALFK